MSFSDRTLPCRDCGVEFLFSSKEQEFYQAKGFENDPARCPGCRTSRKAGRRNQELTEVACAACGVVTEVPFKPTGTKPVYCRDCFAARA